MSTLTPLSVVVSNGSIDCLALHRDRALPVCLFLFGGGGSVDNLSTIRPLLDEGMETGAIPEMTVACAGVPPWCFYLDDGEERWETVVADTLLSAVRAQVPSSDEAGLVGMSMGGYGALKIALSRPRVFSAVAAVAPMLEPSDTANGAPLRNRFHYPPEVPQRLLGAQRDEALWWADHPACRARRHREELRELAIRLDAGSRDAVNAHDGAEHLHRVLWDLDVPHEYVLWRDADHVGPTIVPRLREAFAFVGRYLGGEAPPKPSAEERGLREMLTEARGSAVRQDATTARTYGIAPWVGGRTS